MKKRKKMTFIPMFIVMVIVVAVVGLYLKSTVKEPVNQNVPVKKEKKEVSKDLFGKYYEKAESILNKMTLEEKVGQLFLVRYDKSIVSKYNEYYPGGYILFAKDFENYTKESIKNELDSNQKLSKYPLIFGVDEEGGYVTRVSRFKNFRSERFASPKYYFEQGGYELLEQMENEKLTLLKSLGINLNLAPVADISTNENDFIYNRSFGYDKDATSEFIKNMVTYANNNKINSCLKHFPGYGNNADTHTGVAIDERDYNNFLENDFKPFAAGIEAKVPSILVSHNIVKSIDDKYPSSLSEKVVNELRNTLKFTGIIMTDDLAMDAVKEYVENSNAATLAINAGCDMIITSDFETMKNEVIESVNNKTISEEKLNTAVKRIIAWKYYSGLYE